MGAARSVSLQSLLSQHTDFRAAFEPLQEKLSGLRVRVQAEDGLQRNLPAKQAQLSRLQVRGPWGPSPLRSGAQPHRKQRPSLAVTGKRQPAPARHLGLH